MSEVKVNKISPRSGTNLTVGDNADVLIIPNGVTEQVQSGGSIQVQSGGSVTIASGATITNSGTATGFGESYNGAVNWSSTIKTGTFTAASGTGYFCNTTASAFTVNLPAGTA